MTIEQIEAMVGRWIHAELEASEELRATSPTPDEDQWEGQKDILGDQGATVKRCVNGYQAAVLSV